MRKTGYSQNDRRYGKRYDMPLKLVYLDPATNRPTESVAKNICNKGLRFPVNEKLQKGTVLELKIEDPFSDIFISSDAEVVWTEEFVSGEEDGDVRYEVGVRLSKKRIY